MNNPQDTNSLSVDEAEGSPSLREVAAYLRGVADATAALSEPPLSAPAHSVRFAGETILEVGPALVRKTMPYNGNGVKRQTIPAPSMVEFPSLEAIEDLVLEGEGRCENEPFLDERPSDVRLRVGKLSPEWRELLGSRVA